MKQSTCLLCIVLLVSLHKTGALPLMQYFNLENPSSDSEQTTAITEYRQDEVDNQPMIQYETVMPVLKIVLTPIGRLMQPLIEQWLEYQFGPYINTIGRAMEGVSRYATDNLSFQPGDVYYTKSDLVEGYGYNSLLINLPAGKTLTVLTHKSKQKLDIIEELPQVSDSLNEVRKLN
ncbi:AAEL010291-PA [Aedes aegypti]|uniref:Uncharacterized protein n=2 Tax=Aedes aegypti TaxID=7159 RepID=Q16TB8_AEDAE|nr:uncharacterized protein LOC5573101 [Aedes aegypti]XP_021701805.1 uncharacterized protein LOC5573101 [Aedes aegypti]XP_021701806.1 uncharacterized protein LOC5573101 [Aedes aegypti]XP_021701807.1 uncharacterized protein LOC5573101 [Aedes aegypti]XP_021701808.1 uncharacterized protein LOC5573101 [Aedes aegypti]EAT37753.1 AAEL010291-PA [Aedes aegypti]